MSGGQDEACEGNQQHERENRAKLERELVWLNAKVILTTAEHKRRAELREWATCRS